MISLNSLPPLHLVTTLQLKFSLMSRMRTTTRVAMLYFVAHNVMLLFRWKLHWKMQEIELIFISINMVLSRGKKYNIEVVIVVYFYFFYYTTLSTAVACPHSVSIISFHFSLQTNVMLLQHQFEVEMCVPWGAIPSLALVLFLLLLLLLNVQCSKRRITMCLRLNGVISICCVALSTNGVGCSRCHFFFLHLSVERGNTTLSISN